MLRFYDEKNFLIEFEDYYNVVNGEFTPMKQIIGKENISSFSFSLVDDKKTNLKDTSILQVNINDSASIIFMFDNADFKKDEIYNKITPLKEIEVFDYRTSKKKTLALLNVVKEYHPLFFIYIPNGNYQLYANELRYLLFDSSLEDTYSFYIEEGAVIVQKPKTVDEQSVPSKKDDFVIEQPKDNNLAQANKDNNKEHKFNKYLLPIKDFFKQFGPALKANKYHFIFIVVSAFLIGFAGTIGIYNSMVGKTISVLFFICAMVGATLNTFIFIDYFKSHKLKSALFVDSVLFSFLGSLISMGGFIAFYAIDNAEGKENISQGLLILLNYILVVAIVSISICIAYYYDKSKKKKKEQSNSVNE